MTTDHRAPLTTAPIVPVVDLTPTRVGDARGSADVAEHVRRACTEVGFFVVVGHGVDPALLGRMQACSAAFFDLPTAAKDRYRSEPGETLGYVPMGRENLAATRGLQRPADLKEIFDICRPDVPADEYYTSPLGKRFFRPYVWPDRPAEMRTVWTDYYHAMERLAAEIMRVFAAALDLPRDFFADRTDRSVDYLRAIRYPAQDVPPPQGQLRAGEHTDYGTVTLVAADESPGGLQVQTRSGGWADVPHVPDGYVVNIGDMMAQWTNDQWVSTVHRVANPAPGRPSSARQSIVFFQNPNYDTIIEPLPTCVSDRSPARYPPIPAGEWLVQKVTKQRA